MELFVVIAVVAASAIYVIRRLWVSFTSSSEAGCAGGCSGCSGSLPGPSQAKPADACTLTRDCSPGETPRKESAKERLG